MKKSAWISLIAFMIFAAATVSTGFLAAASASDGAYLDKPYMSGSQDGNPSIEENGQYSGEDTYLEEGSPEDERYPEDEQQYEDGQNPEEEESYGEEPSSYENMDN